MYTIATGSASATARSGAPSCDARAPAAATRSAPTAYGSPAVTSTTMKGGTMKWVKPKFEIVELCSEVTSYLFRR